MAHSQSKPNKISRRSPTRTMLLPLPAATVRATALQNHLALEVLRCGQGTSIHLTYLFRAVLLTYLLRDKIKECCDLEVFQSAEAALLRCSLRANRGEPRQLSESDIEPIQIILALHDRQLARVPRHVHSAACQRVLQFANGNTLSLIPQAEDIDEETSAAYEAYLAASTAPQPSDRTKDKP
ncbi:hypothetical protein IST455A_05835 [Burkholderia multivorans]|uniref:hypothetical protein n=1 Tax=Burkholderia multivorans TaxID=87883 RepID=UPI0019997A6C|nr:hypothetical protein [Burkholderia multivorans]CAB5305257.1 hypothetical protein IST495A_00181 [Burkholderia multivorans]CAB5311107.1 hypothetical protein IST419_05857 [Burkholderia multivorans]CAB5318794.1 hypothetical protein IST424_05841 [Burkholderia multivorans]CAB5320256.1 hypothetical protein IST455A_05835 [Burkholderia multivorans]CAB5320341.1 hypothetical protein IST453_05851 [Burkholderia multivorans]